MHPTDKHSRPARHAVIEDASYETFPVEHRQAIQDSILQHLWREQVSTEDLLKFIINRECDEGRDPEHLFNEVHAWLEGRSMEGQSRGR